MVRGCAPCGASFVGLNPLHALFPGNPWHFSPYSPSSRHFLNVLYVAVERVPEFAECVAARDAVADPQFQAELERLRATAERRLSGRRRVPSSGCCARCSATSSASTSRAATARAEQFQGFVAERGESLRLHALHDAIDEHLRAQGGDRYWGWPVWPEELRDPAHAGAGAFEAAHREAVEYHAWLQWLADEQLGAAQRLARELGMSVGLYGDYAVGVNPSGSETWSDQALYRKGAGVGAPPDALALKGQDWGIPPQDPNVLAAERYRRSATWSRRACAISGPCGSTTSWRCSGSGGCRSAWARPTAATCTTRSTTSCPCWRSRASATPAWSSARTSAPCRRRCRTPWPSALSTRIACCCSRSTRAERSSARTSTRAARSRRSPPTTCRPSTGYWTANDIALRQRLALYPSEDLRTYVAHERVRDRRALLEALGRQGLLPADCDGSGDSYSDALSVAIHVYLARSNSALVVLQAEDLVAMADPVNVPGTCDEHANWQRKMGCDLDGDLRQSAGPATAGRSAGRAQRLSG